MIWLPMRWSQSLYCADRWSRGGDFSVEDWRNCYNKEADRIKPSWIGLSLNQIWIFWYTEKRFAKMGIVTWDGALSVEELRKADFVDFEIKSIQNILYRLELWLIDKNLPASRGRTWLGTDAIIKPNSVLNPKVRPLNLKVGPLKSIN